MNILFNKKILLYYFLFISISVIIFLFGKNAVLSDFSISEYLINYSGGMTRRGMLGTVLIKIHEILGFPLRTVILFTQIFFHLLFLFILFKFVSRNFKILNIFDILCLFSPLFIIYPVAEPESLGRKEIFIFLSFIFLVYFDTRNNSIFFPIYSFIVLPFIVLTWELIVLFFPFYFFVFYLKIKIQNFKNFLKIFLLFLPSIFVFIFIWINPLSLEGHKIMCNELKSLDNGCWGASSMLVTATIYFDTWWIHEKANTFDYLRYVIYYIIGFFPIVYYFHKSKSNFKNIFLLEKFENLNFILFIISIPVILIYLFGLDWGRWINIHFSIIYIIFIFLRERGIVVNNYNLTRINFDKKIKFFIFLIFSLSWNPKILLWEDTGSFPIYRIVSKIFKFFINF